MLPCAQVESDVTNDVIFCSDNVHGRHTSCIVYIVS